MKSPALRELANGQACVNCGSVGHTVLAHLSARCEGATKGMAQKVPDWQGAWLCPSCHDRADGRVRMGEDLQNNLRWRQMVILETLSRLRQQGQISREDYSQWAGAIGDWWSDETDDTSGYASG